MCLISKYVFFSGDLFTVSLLKGKTLPYLNYPLFIGICGCTQRNFEFLKVTQDYEKLRERKVKTLTRN